jgi:hypothetical protein
MTDRSIEKAVFPHRCQLEVTQEEVYGCIQDIIQMKGERVIKGLETHRKIKGI